jgi:hypothetical protein
MRVSSIVKRNKILRWRNSGTGRTQRSATGAEVAASVTQGACILSDGLPSQSQQSHLVFTDHSGLHESPGFIREALWTLEDRWAAGKPAPYG